MLSPSGGGHLLSPAGSLPDPHPQRKRRLPAGALCSLRTRLGSSWETRSGAAGGGADELEEAGRPLFVLLGRSRLKSVRLGTHTDTLPSRGHFQTHAAVGSRTDGV